ncbi:type III secretion system protein [Salmonella enterica]
MDAWRKGTEFVRMLERKQEIVQGNIAQAESRLRNIMALIDQHQQEYSSINQQIKLLTPSGVLNRSDIYKGIRRQGALLTHQQMVIQKITQLEEEKYAQEQKLEHYRSELNLLDKRHYKLTFYLKRLRSEHLRRLDNNAENEIQEIACYGRKDF